MEKSVVCTLFEGHYHYGVAALVNSLHKHGFRGSVFIGYRGALPLWAVTAQVNESLHWDGAQTLEVLGDIQLHFLPVDTDYHLTNYKPSFMIRLWNDLIKKNESIVYFDPDIVIKCRWDFYEFWMEHGVAVVHEIVSNDMPLTHPIRMEWRKIIDICGQQINREVHSYINGGFCGVTKKNIEFVNLWATILETAIDHYRADPTKFTSYDKTYPFNFFDQDALNVTAMCSESPISEIGPEGMDFVYGGWTMSHATGSPKPWKKNFIVSALKGIPPSMADKAYWHNTTGAINIYNSLYRKRKEVFMNIASFVGRFYRKT